MTRIFGRRLRQVWPAALLCLTALVLGSAGASQRDQREFRVKPAESYPARDVHENLVVAAEPYETPDEIKSAFGKDDPYKLGFLPVLVVISNNSAKTVRLDRMKVEFITRERQKVEPTPANDVVLRLRGGGRPPDIPGQRLPRLPGSKPAGDKGADVLARAFEMRMVPPQATASGFMYFDVGRRRDWLAGAQLYLTGLVWANDGQELMFYEVDLDKAHAAPRAAGSRR
jgi:hypothetical protein